MIGAHSLNRPSCSPTHQLRRIGRGGVARIDVSAAPLLDLVRYTPSARDLERSDHFKNTASGPCAQIERKAFWAVQQPQRCHMASSQVHRHGYNHEHRCRPACRSRRPKY